MDFLLNEDQTAIKDLAQQIFSDRATDEFLLEFSRNEDVYDDVLWATLAEQGLLGITVPEAFGGTNLGFIELCSILEEQGRRVAPVPLLSSLVLGALPIIEFGSEKQKQRWLPPLVNGEHKLTAAIAELGMSDAIAPIVNVEKKANNWVLNGEKHCVPDGATAACILVPAVDAEGNNTVFLLDSSTDGVEVIAQRTALGLVESSLILNNVELNDEAVLGKPGEGEEILAWVEQHSDTAVCALQVGVCEAALFRTAAFTGERKQFGMPIGAFQSVAMRAADAYIDIEAMRSTYWQAMWRLSEGLRAEAEVRAAKWWACTGGHRVVHATQHLHGGMGADIEFPIHRFFLWAKNLGMMLGGADAQISKLGKLLASDDSVGTAAMEF